MVARDVTDKPPVPQARPEYSGAAGEVASQVRDFRPSVKGPGETPTPAYLDTSVGHPFAKVAQNNPSPDSPKGDTPTATGAPSSGRKQEYGEDGFPIGGRPNDDYKWQKYQQANDWSSTLQNRDDLNAHEKFAAGRMGLQLQRRANDPIREHAAYTDTPDQRISSAQRTLKEWNQDMTTLQGKLNPDQSKLATQVQGELETELKQEEWRKQRFSK